MARRVLDLLLFGGAVLFLWRAFDGNWEPTAAIWRADVWPVIVLSAVFAMAAYVLLAISLGALYQGLARRRMGAVALCTAYFIANIYKYIPGKVATVAVLIRECGHQGLERGKLFQAFIAMMALSVAIGLGLNLTVVLPLLSSSEVFPIACLFIASGTCLIIHPRSNAWITKKMFSLMRGQTQQVACFQPRDLGIALLLQLAAWSCMGISFAALVNVVEPLRWNTFAICVLMYPAAFTAGVLVVIAPAGLGVREAVLGAFLVNVIQGAFAETQGMALAASLVVAHRAVMTGVDVLLYLGAVLARTQLAGKEDAADAC